MKLGAFSKGLLTTVIAFSSEAAIAQSVEDLRDFSIEQLAQLEVTSASRRVEPVNQAPTAIYVITNEEILRSPALTLPDLLREARRKDCYQRLTHDISGPQAVVG